jgi:fluoroacetyl-CoA thioesterase
VVGASYVIEYAVPANQTVPDLLPGLAEFRRGQPVFATGYMVGLMEAPCMAVVYPYLETGESTVGTMIRMSHLGTCPPGMLLASQARTTGIADGSVHFQVIVTNSAGDTVAAGEHELRVIELARFHRHLAKVTEQVTRPALLQDAS